ncbi:unnamed protein product, partial [Larinioides sclopetarius]
VPRHLPPILPFPKSTETPSPPSCLPLAQTIPENHHVSASSSFLPFTSSGHSLPESARTGFIKKQISEVDFSVLRLATCGQYFKLRFKRKENLAIKYIKRNDSEYLKKRKLPYGPEISSINDQ